MFTKREIEIIHLISKGKTSRDIALKMFVSEYTVKTHRKNILRKMRKAETEFIMLVANSARLHNRLKK
ncbi:response regulator transcription factor [Dyadobacter sp. CY323]|uniref:response regulator transcription factor n=1 Tax=Dyadobacter sp. CY323 TaxID=2907302 RepID=UPI001F243958|nr:LuxR C-terminal-related transcriptional regulator [Dyadobacter sp. CY323]MCE6989927.1 LuxR C-terminal-related transcriptional regulator [Dyadobacter sp. CY323]